MEVAVSSKVHDVSLYNVGIAEPQLWHELRHSKSATF
jgi:hypothetical protein